MDKKISSFIDLLESVKKNGKQKRGVAFYLKKSRGKWKMKKQNSYEGTRVFYKNKMESGLFSEVVVINTPLRKYQWQVFILRGGEITYKLYRRSFKGAVKTAEKKLCITSVVTAQVK